MSTIINSVNRTVSCFDNWFQSLLRWRERHIKEKTFVIILALMVGVVAGTAALALKWLIHTISGFLTAHLAINEGNYLYLLYPVAGIIITSLYVRYVVRDNISHGVTRVLYAISQNKSRLKRHNMYTSVIASSITIGFGGSVGAEGPIVYTGAVDDLFDRRFGRLPYRTLDFVFETHPVEWYQTHGTVNYTVDQPFTRITEFKHLTGQVLPKKTTIMKEFSKEFTGEDGQIPYYAVINPENKALYGQYAALAAEYPNLHLLGRLAEYQYYNMDAIVKRALELADRLSSAKD